MSSYRWVLIGCSTGGLKALRMVLGGLDAKLQQSVVIATHTASEDVSMLCALLDRDATLPVIEAVERETALPGVIYLAPAGYHLLIEKNGRFALSVDPKVCYSRPSIDVLFESAAEAFGPAVLGVVLTGANQDGAAGLKAIRAQGGGALVQEPKDAEAPEMPQAALDLAGADALAPLKDIAFHINRLCA